MNNELSTNAERITMNSALRTLMFCAIFACLFLAQSARAAGPNVLFIVVDDLRPELGCYGVPRIQTPHMDRLAAQGVRFEHAYCNIPVCGASRSSFLAGLQPTRTRFMEWDARADVDAPDVPTLPGWFKSHGYRTVSIGKVFHDRTDSEGDWDRVSGDGLRVGETPSWKGRGYVTDEAIAQIVQDGPLKGTGPAFECGDVLDDGYPDGCIANAAIDELSRTNDRPTFLAVGFMKPHLPFNAPRKYWDLYDPKDISLAANPFRPNHAPDAAIHNWWELRRYVGMPGNKTPMSDAFARQLIHGYYACVSYVDAQIGRLLQVLDDSLMGRDTVVVLLGDHGWNLGEHTLWAKQSLFETSLRVPLLLRAAGNGPSNVTCNTLVQLLDIYPTLCDAAGLPIPAHVEGRSLIPLIENASMPWPRESLFARYRFGESIKTDHFRFSRYYDKQWKFAGEMLYDHRTDPDENHSIATARAHRSLRYDMFAQLKEIVDRK
jgi:iduronate 2-sulfatase